MQTTLRSVGLSCRGESFESFLSCALSFHHSLPTLSNLKLNEIGPESLSCGNGNDSESQSSPLPVYRAKRYIMGIDPGLSGAIAIISSGKEPDFIAVYDMPTIKVGGKNRIDLESLANLIQSYSQDLILSIVEEVGQIGTEADPFSSFVFGFATGVVHGTLEAFSVKIQTVKPSIWKSSLGLSSDKDKSIAKAIKFFPSAASKLTRKKDHDRAEALLLAYFANSFMGMK